MIMVMLKSIFSIHAYSASMKKINRSNLLKLSLPVATVGIQRELLRDLAEISAAATGIETRYSTTRNIVASIINQAVDSKGG